MFRIPARRVLPLGGALLIAAICMPAFVLLTLPTLPGTRIKWPTNNISYYINPNGSGLSATETISAIQNAFDAWSQATNGAVTFTYMGTTTAVNNPTDHQNTVFWDTNRTVVTSEALAVTKLTVDAAGNLSDADIAFATNYGLSFINPPESTSCSLGLFGSGFHFGGIPIVWTIGQQGIGGFPWANVFNADVQATATHEIGHLLGLLHTLVPNAVMSTITGATPGFFCTTGQRDLQADDVDGALALYGGGGQSLVTFSFTGVVTDVEDSNILNGLVSIQAPLSGTFSYDSSAPLTSMYAVNADQYQFPPGASDISVTISTGLGPKTISTSGSSNQVELDLPGPNSSAPLFSESGNGSALSWQLPYQQPNAFIAITLVGSTNTFLTSLNLPTALDLTQTLDYSATSFGFSEILGGAAPSPGGYTIRFRLTSLTKQ
jgi:hypothetical protein